ncbi:histidine kinase [Lacinutrix neustonica]|uniref:Histidine kinase n=1 Tax=Lacinutrix neustonica TaxID=2980107 RepID=A0A9E8MVK6_9FLAO|nr:histidine kinase [Lacinutrix neustonica]WAC02171.1 histidine kinase [Lacinutrix neustonica]
MMSIVEQKKWLWIKVFILITLAIPMAILGYEFFVLGNDSVTFLGDYPPLVGNLVLTYYLLLLAIGVLWIMVQLKAVLKLKNENAKNELLHLQSQVNPHFFFNMLNNLYGLVDKDTAQAKALILKLSELMRYSIYEGEKPLVSLEEEADYLNNYMALHRMRYHKTIDIQCNITMEDSTAMVMPLLFIILLENAFKHGVENLRDHAYVHINLTAGDGVIDFDVENNFDTSELPETQGIGIKNLKRRLELAYPKKHRLIITSQNEVYKVQLQLQP